MRRLAVPFPAVVVAAAGLALVALPLVGLVARVAWADLPGALRQPGATEAVRLSLVTSALATVVAAVLGLPLAWVLARGRFRGRSLVRAVVLVPLVLPPVVGGVALLSAFGPATPVGRVLDGWGLVLPFSTAGAVLAEAFVALPFFVLTVEAGLRGVDRRYEEVAATLGASRWHALQTVSLPMARPALVAGTVLAWARALGEFGATITFAGNVAGRTRTLPLAVYVAFESDPALAVALSLVLLVVSLGVIVALRDRWLGGAG